MDNWTGLVLWGLGAYLLGAIPFGYYVGKWHRLDIRTLGSRNIGATNITRVLGKPWGRAVFLLDFLKGFLPTLFTHYYIVQHTTLGSSVAEADPLVSWVLLYFLLPIIGHIFPIFLKFKGGKGVATTAGVLVVLSPGTFIGTLIVFGVLFYKFRIISVASLSAVIILPIIFIVSGQEWMVAILTPLGLMNRSLVLSYPNLFLGGWLGLGAWVMIRHRTNIKRLLAGTEQAFKQ